MLGLYSIKYMFFVLSLFLHGRCITTLGLQFFKKTVGSKKKLIYVNILVYNKTGHKLDM